LDYYAILGVHPTAEDIVIRAAYKALAQRYHPDRATGPQDAAHAKMSELTKAYEVLADPVRRQKYDRRRLAYTQSVANYFNGVPRDSRIAIDPRKFRSPAAMRTRSRVALSMLMVAVVVLSAFNLYQYSGQLRDWLSPGAPAQPSVEARVRTPPEASGSIAVGSSAVGVPPSAAGTLSGPAEAQSRAPGGNTADASASAAPRGPAPGDASSPKGIVEPVTRQIASDAPSPRAVPVPAQPAATAAAPDSTRGASSLPVATPSPASRPATTPAPTDGSAPCSDAVAALGLCRPPTTARTK
jgi:curved DNA-binding protein CbpA